MWRLAGVVGLRYVSRHAKGLDHWQDFVEDNRPLESEYEMQELLMGKAGIDRIVADAEAFLA